MRFPAGFLWGAATAAYQIEGAVREDGRGESIWDRFAHTPGKVAGGDTGDAACDHYHRWAQDVDLMADLGLQAYRFSIAWPRLFPDGSGRPNARGVDFYKRLVERLHARSIRPVATLYHWDLPQALQEKGGWANRDTAWRFQEYAAAAFRELGEGVDDWTTINEPWCAAFLGYALGQHAPGLTDWPAAVRASHHLLLAHGLAVRAFRDLMGPGKRVGITLNMTAAEPASENEADRAAARRYDGFFNRWFADPVFLGRYPEDMLAWYEAAGALSGPVSGTAGGRPSETLSGAGSGTTRCAAAGGGSPAPDWLRPGDMALISAPIDFLGLNYYTRTICQNDPSSRFFGLRTLPPRGPVTDQNWEIAPRCLRDLLARIQQDWTRGLPIYIHENGAAMADELTPDGHVHDPGRIAFLRDHLAAAGDAIAASVNLKGYFVWSLLDNFEWAWGYAKRFGIVYVDYATQRRIPKDSAFWYREVIGQNGW